MPKIIDDLKPVALSEITRKAQATKNCSALRLRAYATDVRPPVQKLASAIRQWPYQTSLKTGANKMPTIMKGNVQKIGPVQATAKIGRVRFALEATDGNDSYVQTLKQT